MESFSEYIKQYLSIKNISFSNAAKMCGIDRTILGRYANGSRKPQSMDVIIKLSDGLQMLPHEKNKLYEAYRRTKISEEYCTDYALLSAIVNEKHVLRKAVRDTVFPGIDTFAEDCTSELYGKETIFEAINYIKNGAAYIKMYVSPQELEWNEEVQNVFADMQGIRQKEQIICLKHREWQYGEEKMKNIHCLLPFLLQKERTSVYYYYQRENNNDNQEKYYLVTDKGVVFFNQQLTRGFFSSQKVPCDYYAVLFDKMKTKCRIFAEGGMEVFRKSKFQSPDEMFENEKSGITFYGQKENNSIWILKEEYALAACIREAGSVQLLWKFIWDNESEPHIK